MLIHVAQNGFVYDIDCHGDTLVEFIYDTLESRTRIPKQDQLLICGDTRLEPSRSLGSYNLPSPDIPVFLYNRMLLLPNSCAPEVVEPDESAITVQYSEASNEFSSRHPLDDSSNPLLRALPSYERQFNSHVLKAEAIALASSKRYELACKLLQEQEVQEMAVQTACGNMGAYYSHICRAYEDFTQQFQAQHSTHSEYLACFQRDLARLSQIQLHRALQSEHPLRRTLLDYVKEPWLRKVAQDCSVSYSLFSKKVSELSSLFSGLQESVEGLLCRPSDISVEHLRLTVEGSRKYIQEQSTNLQSLSKDLSRVRKLLEECTDNRTSVVRPLDACAALDPMNEVHLSSHLPRMEWCDRQLATLASLCRERKLASTQSVHVQLKTVAALQSRIRDLRNQLAAFREALRRQEIAFSDLALVRQLAHSYHACLAEVLRRRHFDAIYRQRAHQLAENMARMREDELSQRSAFMQEHCPRYIPKDMLGAMGLLDSPSLCEVTVPDFDTNLIHISVRDLPTQGSEYDWDGNDAELSRDSEDSLQLQNTWLQAELASALAKLQLVQNNSGSERGECKASEELARAVGLKDALCKELQERLKAEQMKSISYAERIRKLEDTLQKRCEQEMDERGVQDPSQKMPLCTVSEVTSEDQAASSASSSASLLESDTEEGSAKQQLAAAADALKLDGSQDILVNKENDVHATVDKAAAAMDSQMCAGLEKAKSVTDELMHNAEVVRDWKSKMEELEMQLAKSREECRIHRITSERSTVEYDSLRSESVKVRGLLERIVRYVVPPGNTGLALEPLRMLVKSLSTGQSLVSGSSILDAASNNEEWTRQAVALLAGRVADLAERNTAADAKIDQLRRQLDASASALNSVTLKLQKSEISVALGRQKLSYTRFHVNELAAFLPNRYGHYVAISRNCPSHYLSEDSVALFRSQSGVTQTPDCIVGQIVHVEKGVARGSPGDTPYDLPSGTVYAVVSLALVPDMAATRVPAVDSPSSSPEESSRY